MLTFISNFFVAISDGYNQDFLPTLQKVLIYIFQLFIDIMLDLIVAINSGYKYIQFTFISIS